MHDAMLIVWLSLLVVTLLAFLRLWLRQTADLLWMLAIQPVVTGLGVLCTSSTIYLLLCVAFGSQLFAAKFALVILFTPPPARMVVEMAALLLSKENLPAGRSAYFLWFRMELASWIAGLSGSILLGIPLTWRSPPEIKLAVVLALGWLLAKPIRSFLRGEAVRRGRTWAQVRGSMFEMVDKSRQSAIYGL